MHCTFSGHVCTRCGHPSRRPDLPRNCRPGLGDWVAAGLSAAGITPETVAAVFGYCGCHERRDAMNRAGYAVGIGAPPEPGSTPPQNPDNLST